ncbi:MAG: tetratricopeptide repeat protein [Opitutae bacterium]|nr:tetratricopeptide repeat protein [Opitutae bacterium]
MSDSAKAVFLSYASQDADAAKRIADALRAAGVEVWFDQSELVGGDAWDAKIRGQIGSCALFVPVISANTQARREGYFRLEWKLAAQRTHMMSERTAFLLPVIIDATRDAEADVPGEFRAVQFTKLPGGEMPGKFCAQVKKLLGGSEMETGRPRPVERDEGAASPATPKVGQRVPAPTWLAAGAALALAAGGYLWFKSPTESAPLPAQNAGAGTRPPAPAKEASTESKSVAVLAFANLSDDKGNDSFGDSVSEELLNVLAKVPGLKVTARTSAFHFKGKDTPIPEIARQLGVAYVVEGSVRRSGEKVRITAQLIKAADGFHVWSDTFTRDLKDIFAVQDEIAGLIADKLQLKLGLKANRAALNPEAYQLYLEAARAWNQRDNASLDRAERLLRRALALQPDFARAVALMANIFSTRGNITNAADAAPMMQTLGEQALVWADRALTLDPDLAEGYAAKGNALDRLGRWGEAKAAYRRSTELDPNYATGHQWYARSLSQEGYLDEALAEMRRAMELDPLAPRILDNYAAQLQWAGRNAEALEVLDRALAIQPGSLQARSFKAGALINLGRHREALAILEELKTQPSAPEWIQIDLARALQATGRGSEAQTLPPPTDTTIRGLLLCQLGRPEEGIPLLKPRASIHRDVLLWTYPEAMPRESPEFLRKLAEWGMADSWQRAEAWRAKNLPKKAAPSAVVTPAPDDKSVAVLAFANLSSDKEQEYFSDGISEELLNVLAKVPGLKVSARTSAFHFKGKDTPIPEIAQKLGVAYVVEGSVRKAGDKVRITAQLIKAADGFHVWSDTFTRDLKDIFAVQDEIAGLIAKNLSLRLGVDRSTSGRPAVPEAYELYLQGRAAWNLRTPEGYARAESLLSRAIDLDPGFARAHTALADVWSIAGYENEIGGGTYGWRNSPTVEKIAAKANQALALDPQCAEAYTSQALAFEFRWELAAAERSYRRAIELNPNYSTARHWFGMLLWVQGEMDEALRQMQLAAASDPLSHRILDTNARMLNLLGRPAEALAVADRALALQPHAVQAATQKAHALVLLGRTDEAVTLIEKALAWGGSIEQRTNALVVLHMAGADAAMRRVIGSTADMPASQFKFASLIALGRPDEALVELRPADLHENQLISTAVFQFYDPVREDPRFLQAISDVGFMENYRRARAWLTANLPKVKK